MTHIYDEIQLDSLLVLDILLETFPYLMVSKSNQVLINFVDQISRHQGHGKGSRSLTTNPNSKTSSLKWRISVLNRLEKFLVAILDSQKVSLGSHMDPAGHKLHWSPDKPTYANCCPRLFRHSWETPGFTLRWDITISWIQHLKCQENLHLKRTSVYVICWIFLQTFQTYFCIQANSVDPDQSSLIRVHTVCINNF